MAAPHRGARATLAVTVVYPARGIAELWSAPAAAPHALAAVLGATRAALLTDLAAPSTTTALAAPVTG